MFGCIRILKHLATIEDQPLGWEPDSPIDDDDAFVDWETGVSHRRHNSSLWFEHFVNTISEFESLHTRPCGDGGLINIEQYVRDILPCIKVAMKLTDDAMEDIAPHVAFMIHFRLHALRCPKLFGTESAQFFILQGTCALQGDTWYHRTLADMPIGMSYSAEHFKAFPPETSLAQLAIIFRMHPFMLCDLAN